MARSGNPANELYATHLFGANFKQNPKMANKAMIQRMYVRILTELATNRFKWQGLPDSIDTRFLEMSLFYTALCVYYHDSDYDKDLAVRGSGVSYVNMLDNPTQLTVIGPGTVNPTKDDAIAGFRNKQLSAYDPVRHQDLTDEEKRLKAIPIWANYVRRPDLDIVQIYSNRLAEIDVSIQINAINSRHPKILKTSENTKLSMINAVRQIDEGQELIQLTGPIQDMDWIDTLDLGVDPKSFTELSTLRNSEWSRCMGLLGINNANQDKKERLVESEVGANDEQTDNMRFVNLNARRIAAKHIKDVFGHDVTVEYNTKIEEQAEQMRQDMIVGDNNGNVHNDAKESD